MTLIAMFMLVCTVIYRAILAQHSSECQKFTCVYHSLFMNQYSCISLPQDPSMNPQAYPKYKLDFKYNAVFLRST